MKILVPREIHFRNHLKNEPQLTVFLGIYNGSQYLESLFNQINNQKFQDFNLLVVDNASTDDSLEKLFSWKNSFSNRLTLVTNSTNLGAHGSMQNNFDLIVTPWFAQMHQDDFYFPNHLETLHENILNSDPNIIAVSTLMGSMNSEGVQVSAPPRASMFIQDFDCPSALLQNLRTHCVPEPSSAFNTAVFRETFSLFHSTAFPDTEQVLRLCSKGKFKYIAKETMLYRENPLSQSHSVERLESVIETYMALSRYFHSFEFKEIFLMVEKFERVRFIQAVLSAIKYRLNHEALVSLLSLSILEKCIEMTNYGDANLNSLAAKAYKSTEFKFPANLLSRLGYESSSESCSDIRLILADFTQTESDNMKPTRSLVKQLSKSTYGSLGKYVPLWLRKIFWKMIQRSALGSQINERFLFDWRK